MAAQFEPLISLLEIQLAQYAKVLELGRRKQGYIVAGQIDELEQAVRAETSELLKAGGTEKKRLAATELLAQELGLKPDISLTEIIAAAPAAAQERLLYLQGKFATLVKELTALNKLNHELLETNIAYTDMMLGVILGTEDPLNNFYSDDGSMDADTISNPGFFDQEI